MLANLKISISPRMFTVLFALATIVVVALGGSITALTILEKPVPEPFIEAFGPALTGLLGLISFPHGDDDSEQNPTGKL